jgi:hypothetical protein
LIGNGADFNLAALTAGSNVTITNSAGGITIASTNPSGTVTGVTATSPLASTGGTTPDISLSGTVGVANGGTGATTLTANNVLLGNGTSVVQFVAPGTSGNVLTSNGTTWASTTIAKNFRLACKTADQSVTSSTTLVDASSLEFTMDANKSYIFETTLYMTANTSGGYKIGFTGPSTPTKLRIGVGSAFASGGQRLFAELTAYGTLDTYTSTPTALTYILQGKIENGGNAGAFKVQFAQGASNANATIMEKASFIQWAEVT